MESVINLVNQNHLDIKGIEKIKNATPTEILGEINGQTLFISGQDMEVKSLDIENKILVIDGSITGIKFQTKKPSLLKRIFK